MKNSLKHSAVAAFLIGGIAAIAAIGCAGNTSEESGPATSVAIVNEGLTLLEVSPATGRLAGAFKDGSHVIYFLAVRGPAVNEYYKNNDPDAPEFEVDARFQDANGDVFMTQMGGDTFIDPSWNAAVTAHPKLPDNALRQKDFRLAWKVADTLAMRSDLPVAVRSLTEATRNLARAMNEQGLQITQKDVDKQMVAMPGDLKPTDVGYDTGAHYHHSYWINNKCIALCLGNHTAVQWYSFYSANTGYSYTGYSCNHGSCANTMSNKCNRMSGQRSNTTPQFQNETTQGITSVTGGCSTPYGWTSGAGAHNCNDDSWLQMYNVANNVGNYSTTGGNCGTSGMNNYSPACL